MNQEELKELKRMQMTYGVYEITKALKDLATETSKEYKDAGNMEAIVHRDAAILQHSVLDMMLAHPLRIMKDGVK